MSPWELITGCTSHSFSIVKLTIVYYRELKIMTKITGLGFKMICIEVDENKHKLFFARVFF